MLCTLLRLLNTATRVWQSCLQYPVNKKSAHLLSTNYNPKKLIPSSSSCGDTTLTSSNVYPNGLSQLGDNAPQPSAKETNTAQSAIEKMVRRKKCKHTKKLRQIIPAKIAPAKMQGWGKVSAISFHLLPRNNSKVDLSFKISFVVRPFLIIYRLL